MEDNKFPDRFPAEPFLSWFEQLLNVKRQELYVPIKESSYATGGANKRSIRNRMNVGTFDSNVFQQQCRISKSEYETLLKKINLKNKGKQIPDIDFNIIDRVLSSQGRVDLLYAWYENEYTCD